MHLLPYNLCPCRAASAKIGENEEGWRGAINFVSSEQQCPVDSDMITSSFSAHAFVTDQVLLPLPLNVIISKSLIPGSCTMPELCNPSSIAQVQKCCKEA